MAGPSFGAARPDDFASTCDHPLLVQDGTTLDLGARPPQELLMEVTVRRPGSVLTRGADVTYSHGWQEGIQTTGTWVRITAR